MKCVKLALENNKRNYRFSLWFFFIMLSIAIYRIVVFEVNNNELSFISALFIALAFIGGCFVYYAYVEYNRLKNIDKHINLYFKYNNGDELLISDKLLVQHREHEVELVKTTTEKLKWGFDNIREAVEQILNDTFPVSLLVPSIQVTTTVNSVPPIINIYHHMTDTEFSFIDLEKCKLLMIKVITKTSTGKLYYSLTYPITDEIKFSVEDYENFINKMLSSRKVGAHYINEEIWNKREIRDSC